MGTKKDLDRYWDGMKSGDWETCLNIERKYGLDGYPPDVVTTALQAKADGKDMEKAIDEMLGV